MSLSNSRLAYTDCYDLLDRALDADRGIRIELPGGRDAANYLRMRIHHARTIDRADNTRTYPEPDDPMHGRSAYDVLICRIEEIGDRAWLWLDKQKVEIGLVEEIPTEAQIEGPKPLLQIEGPKAEVELPVALPAPIPQIRRR